MHNGERNFTSNRFVIRSAAEESVFGSPSARTLFGVLTDLVCCHL
jgi:hypothetical protein